jgi:hypothetical protein
VVGSTAVVDPYNLFCWSTTSSVESKAVIWSCLRGPSLLLIQADRSRNSATNDLIKLQYWPLTTSWWITYLTSVGIEWFCAIHLAEHLAN